MTAPGLRRLDALQDELGMSRAQIVQMLADELDVAMGRAAAGLGPAPDLARVAQAAHAARSSALMLDARPLLGALDVLERCARTGDVDGARAALDPVTRAWSSLRERLPEASPGTAELQ